MNDKTSKDEASEVDEDLALDLRVYGTCYWKYVDGRKVRIHPQDIRYINGVPKDSTNTVASRAERQSETTCPHCVDGSEHTLEHEGKP
jgi:hypothetical protein